MVPLQMLIDFKSDGPTTFRLATPALTPLVSASYLTTFDSSTNTLTPSALTIVGTGNTAFSHVSQQASRRTIFYDAPLNNLTADPWFSGASLTPLASADFGSTIGWLGIVPISSSGGATIGQWFSDAHSRGIKVYDTRDYLTAVME